MAGLRFAGLSRASGNSRQEQPIKGRHLTSEFGRELPEKLKVCSWEAEFRL
ncbi:hypothetical protein [Sphingobium sp. PAMC28499]|uniref:hypothetical protein n=1 Tax=Sphingobium sp. PAMC28499 TaxID=2565554 RepID=UPI0014460270|nr:hypothetical protein [Sphingobium sp. PAMC28499]